MRDVELHESRSAEADGYGLAHARREPPKWELDRMNRWSPELGEWISDPPVGVW